jgi:2-methylisocitrate lyase-like PEP mutase family enzyme
MSSNAKLFRELHHKPEPLILANAWDAGTARLIENLGGSAVATTSAGVAWALGYPDGIMLPVDKIVQLAQNIVRVIRIPLSVDIEGGYTDNPTAIGETIRALLGVGVIGINIEDGTDSPDLLAAKIEQVKKTANSAGIDLFVNARTDVYLRGLVAKDKRVAETVARGARYKAAGADGFFVPALAEASDITEIVQQVDLPINVMAVPALPPAAELGKLGVHRLSAGSGIAQMAWGMVERLSQDFLNSGRSEQMMEGSMPYRQIQDLFVDRK